MGVWLGWEGERLISCKQLCICIFPDSWLYLYSYIWVQHLPFTLPFLGHHHYHHLGHWKSLSWPVDLSNFISWLLAHLLQPYMPFCWHILAPGPLHLLSYCLNILSRYPPASLFYSFKSLLKCHFTEIFTLDKIAFPITISLPYPA